MGRTPVSEEDKRIGQRIKLARQLRGFSQTTLSTQLGISFQQLQKYEKAHNRVSASKLMLIASITKLPISWFYESQTPPDVDLESEWLVAAIALSRIKDKAIQKSLLELIKAHSNS